MSLCTFVFLLFCFPWLSPSSRAIRHISVLVQDQKKLKSDVKFLTFQGLHQNNSILCHFIDLVQKRENWRIKTSSNVGWLGLFQSENDLWHWACSSYFQVFRDLDRHRNGHVINLPFLWLIDLEVNEAHTSSPALNNVPLDRVWVTQEFAISLL